MNDRLEGSLPKIARFLRLCQLHVVRPVFHFNDIVAATRSILIVVSRTDRFEDS